MVSTIENLKGIKNENVRLVVRSQSDLLENENELIESAQFNNFNANLEAWTAIGTNKELAYATHGAFRYFGKFPPPIATYLIEKHTQEGDLVWDPMSGSGTTGVESLLLGRNCILNDVSPLSRLLAKVKTTYIERELMEKAVERVTKEHRPMSEEEYPLESLSAINVNHWFLPETIASLRGLRFVIDQETNENIKDFLMVVFASTVRRVSRATTQQGRLFLDVKTACEDAIPTFLKRAKIAIEGISCLPPGNNHLVKIIDHNLVNPLSEEYNESTSLVILHPPYFNSYKYSSVNSLELAWLGYNHANVRKNEVREFFKVGKPEKVDFYVQDMIDVIKNVKKLLKPHGVIGLMIGDTIMKGTHIPATKMILEEIEKEGLSIETIALRVPKYTEATWVASQRRKSGDVGITLYDYVITLRRVD
ncbi:DNA methyltransferase [Priestia flexa]|uniref:DNA methyltransferase n=1 Tax=Priestia flexa TaxID=86664 RepID=UPI0024BF2A75|nr:DNA methyltransferase [Priestia flexa]WHX78843.1 DNA methyltransferase [Priestia flexa]